MNWRCANDYFGYCSEKPVWKEKPIELGAGAYLAMGTCKRNPETCGKYQTFIGQLEGINFPTSEYKVVRGKLVKK